MAKTKDDPDLLPASLVEQENGHNVQVWTRRTIVPLAGGKSADLNVEARDQELLKTLAAVLANTF